MNYVAFSRDLDVPKAFLRRFSGNQRFLHRFDRIHSSACGLAVFDDSLKRTPVFDDSLHPYSKQHCALRSIITGNSTAYVLFC